MARQTVIWICIVLLALSPLSSATGDNWEDLDDLDFDLDLEDEGDVKAAPVTGVEPAGDYRDSHSGSWNADFDMNLPESERWQRMFACWQGTQMRMRFHESRTKQFVADVAKHHHIALGQAFGNVVYSWTMNCYLNSDEESMHILQLLMAGDLQYERDLELRVFRHRSDRHQLDKSSFRQADLIRSVIWDQQQAFDTIQFQMVGSAGQFGQFGADAFGDFGSAGTAEPSGSAGSDGRGARGAKTGEPDPANIILSVDLPGAGMSSSSKTMYMLAVFGVTFIAFFLVVFQLQRSGHEEDERKAAKRAKKAGRNDKSSVKKHT